MPQGSLLGPLIFNLYINDLPKDLTCRNALYADDLKLFAKITRDNQLADFENFQINIDRVYDWSVKWNLPINFSKCAYMSFTKNSCSALQIHHIRNYTINSQIIEKVTSHVDLGVTLDSQLNFKNHISNITSKANRAIFSITNAFQFSDLKTKVRLYKCYVIPLLEYASPVWNNYCNSTATVLERTQRRATRILVRNITKSPVPYSERLKMCDLKELSIRRTVNDLSKLFNCINGNSSVLNCETLGMIKSKSLAKPNNFMGQFCRSNQGKNEFSKRTVKLWNSLPANLKTNQRISTFKSKLYIHLLNK